MSKFINKCFVCNIEVEKGKHSLNKEINLPVCQQCLGTDNEREKTEEYLNSLADDLICGCI